MMAHLRDKYDRIVIDSPPLAAVSDALILLPMVDGIVYVIKFNSVKRKTAVLNVRRLWESNVPVFGSILNYVSSTMSNYYYSQYSDKSYRNYYISDDDFDNQIEPVIGEKDEVDTEAEIAEAAIATEGKEKSAGKEG
jgi:Mrp family chromosome partitioning ATPase